MHGRANLAIGKAQADIARLDGPIARHYGLTAGVGDSGKAPFQGRFGMKAAGKPRQRVEPLLPLLNAPDEQTGMEHLRWP